MMKKMKNILLLLGVVIGMIVSAGTAHADSASEMPVAAFQEKLIQLGFLHDVADGSFGKLTRAATEEFQSVYGLDVTGAADAETQAALSDITECLSDEPLQDPLDIVVWETVEVQHDTAGRYYVQPNTVSDMELQNAQDIMRAVIEAYCQSDQVPEDDSSERSTEEGDGILFRNITIRKIEDQYQVDPNTVSSETLREVRKVYTAIRYAYLNSREIYHLSDGRATATDGNTAAEYDAGQTAYEPPVQEAAIHTHNWTPVYKSVHYDAGTHLEPVYVTVHHDAVTHQEPIYETVYHPAVYEQQFAGYRLNMYEALLCYCGAEFSTVEEWDAHFHALGRGHGAYRTESRYYEDTSQPFYENILIQDEYYEDVLQGYETVVDSPAYEEQVLDHYEEVTDQAAHDEQVVDYYVCNQCGATK